MKNKYAGILLTVMCSALVFTFSSCIYLEDIRPKTSETEQSEENESSIKEESSQDEKSADESSIAEISVDESEPSMGSVEESSETPVLESYDYNGFTVTGFEVSDIVTLIDGLENTIHNAGVNISIYYEELDTGYSIAYRKDVDYCSGSVIKAPYAMFLMSADVDLNQNLTLQASQKMDGSGYLKNNSAGSVYTIEKLIEYSIKDSDNTAYKMLYDYFGFGDFSKYTYRLGIDTGCSSTENLGYLGSMSAYDAAVFFKDIYKRSQTEDTANRLLGYLSNTTYNNLLPAGITNHTVAHKYGYMSGSYKVLHDVGIVLDTHPYVIAIMTDFDPTGGNGRSTFKSLASSVNAFHDGLSY